MYTNPKQNPIEVDHILLDQFRRKGYCCKEMKEENSVIVIITHEKKSPEPITSLSEAYSDLLKRNLHCIIHENKKGRYCGLLD